MAPIVPFPPPGFDDLSVDEKLNYVQLLKSIREAAAPLSMPAARSLAEGWQRRLAGKTKGDSSELIREDRER
jgi:hypothetical protein